MMSNAPTLPRCIAIGVARSAVATAAAGVAAASTATAAAAATAAASAAAAAAGTYATMKYGIGVAYPIDEHATL